MTNTQDLHAAVRRSIAAIEKATLDEPAEYWQRILDDLEPYRQDGVCDALDIACGFLQSLRDRDDESRTRADRLSNMREIEAHLWEYLADLGGLTEEEQMAELVALDEANKLLGLGPDDESFPEPI